MEQAACIVHIGYCYTNGQFFWPGPVSSRKLTGRIVAMARANGSLVLVNEVTTNDLWGVLARKPGINVLRIDPSLTINEEDVEGFLDALEPILIE